MTGCLKKTSRLELAADRDSQELNFDQGKGGYELARESAADEKVQSHVRLFNVRVGSNQRGVGRVDLGGLGLDHLGRSILRLERGKLGVLLRQLAVQLVDGGDGRIESPSKNLLAQLKRRPRG